MGLRTFAKGADGRGRGQPNINRFVRTDILTYGFDFQDRASKYTDLTGNHTVTPYKVLGNFTATVADPTVATVEDYGMGVRVHNGCLVSSITPAAISAGGAPFTLLILGRDSGFTTQGTYANLFSYGYNGGSSGIGVSRHINAAQFVQIEASTSNLGPSNADERAQPTLLFVTYDGAGWRAYDYTNGTSTPYKTNTELSVGNPMALSSPGGLPNKICLGGNINYGSLAFGNAPVIHQQAMWSAVLTDAEMADQYARSKLTRPRIGI